MDWIFVMCNNNEAAKPFEKMLNKSEYNFQRITQRYYLIETTYFCLAYAFFQKERYPNSIKILFTTTLYDVIIPKEIKDKVATIKEWKDEEWEAMKKKKLDMSVRSLKNV